MQNTRTSRVVGAATLVAAVALGGFVMDPAPAAHAAPTAWQCTDDTFEVKRGNTLTQVDVPTSVVTSGPNLSVSPPLVVLGDINAIGLHPITRIVYAVQVFGPNYNATIARVINPDGIVEDVSAQVPLTGATASDYAGGTFTSDGYWLLANGAGQVATIDLTSPASPFYGTAISVGTTGVPWLSGDMAYRASDDRVYFTTWGAGPGTIRVGWIQRAAFVAGGAIVPTFGPTVLSPSPLQINSGAASGFDSNGNLWMSTTTDAPGVPPGSVNVLWRLDGAALTGANPIIPTVITGVVQPGSGSDGFMCFGAANVPEVPTLPAAGLSGEANLGMLGGLGVLLTGMALLVVARRRLVRTRRSE